MQTSPPFSFWSMSANGVFLDSFVAPLIATLRLRKSSVAASATIFDEYAPRVGVASDCHLIQKSSRDSLNQLDGRTRMNCGARLPNSLNQLKHRR